MGLERETCQVVTMPDQLNNTEITEYSLVLYIKSLMYWSLIQTNVNMKTINSTTEGYLHNCRIACVR